MPLQVRVFTPGRMNVIERRINDMNVVAFIKSRRTIRKFKQTPLFCEQLEKYIDVARVAPSSANMQPLKYVAVQTASMVEKVFPLLKWAGYLPEYTPKEGERPVAYIVVCIDKNIRSAGVELDVGAAVENIILAALSDHVGSCWIGSVNRKKVAELLDIKEPLEISCVVALGYPKESPIEVAIKEDVKYYLNGETLCVPKRALKDVLIKTV